MGFGSGKELTSVQHRSSIELTAHRQLHGYAVNMDAGDSVETESLLDSEIDGSYSEKLQQYIQSYPEFTNEFKAVLGSVGKLDRLSGEENAFRDKLLLSKINKEVLKLRKRSIKAAFSPGTPNERKYNLLANFIVDIDAAELFSLLAEKLFDSYFDCEKQQRSNGVNPGKLSVVETDGMDQLASESLILTLLVIQNYAEFHKQFCVACTTTTPIVSLCLTNSKQVEVIFKTVDSDRSGRPVRAIRVLGCCFNILYNLASKN